MEEKTYRNCFVCGEDNPTGLKLEFAYDDTSAWAEFASPQRFEGYIGVIHGGIIATLLDEAMAKVILKQGIVAVTADLQIRYRKPLPVLQTVTVRGEITLQKTRTLHTKAVLSDAAGNVYAEGTAVYITVKHL